LPVGVLRRADALEGFDRHLPPAVVFALHEREPSGKPLRGKGVAGGGDFRLAWFGASEGNMPAIRVQPPFYVPVICGFTKYVSGAGGRMPTVSAP